MLGSRLTFALLVAIAAPATLCGQELRTWPTTLVRPVPGGQGDCYYMYLYPLQPGLTIDLKYSIDGGPEEVIEDWPTFDSNGYASNICTDETTPLGVITFTGWRPWDWTGENWIPDGWQITVLDQPTGMSINPSSGYAGDGAEYWINVQDGASMTVIVAYSLTDPFGNVTWGDGSITTDEYGNYYSGPLGHNVAPGTYVIDWMSREEANHDYNWVPVNPPVVYTLYPPRPTWTSLSAATVQAGAGSYTLTVGNGAQVTLDTVYTFDNGPETPIPAYPYLAPVSAGSPDGRVTFDVMACKPPGPYTWKKIKNTLHADTPASWLAMDQTVTVTAPAAPTVSSASPSSGARLGATNDVSVTIDGANLCNVLSSGNIQIATTWPGLSFDAVTIANENDPGTQITTVAHISPTAWVGEATVTVTATSGQATFLFTVTNGQAPQVTGVSPGSGAPGTEVAATISGANLTNAALSTDPPWNGLSFTNVSSNPQGTSLTATFAIAAGATLGTPTIKATTNAGSVTTQLFTIAVPPPPLVSSVNPSSAGPGSSLTVTMTGSNLIAPALSTAWSGLTFSNVLANGPGTSLTATFTISSGASTGAPTIQVTTPGGSVNTQLFSITSGGALSLFWKKDYIQDDSGLVLATAVPKPADETAPGVPTGVGYSGLTSTSVTISWTGVGDSGGSGLGGYKVYRQRGSEASLPVGSVGPSSTSFVDPTLQPGTTYTIRLSRAHDKRT